jgi:hypothetical protein
MGTNAPHRVDRAMAFALIALMAGGLWTLFVNGAVPFAGMPTMGQAASMMGYAQAFADQHWYSLHARSFGYPVPTSLATGLPLAWLAGWFVRMGMPTYDAYSAAAAFWLIAGYAGAFQLARALGVKPVLAALAAATWMSLPMTWAHQSYSSLALGMGMLPLYLRSALAQFDMSLASNWRKACSIALFVALCVIALFMDGYTFMMFAVASGIMFAFQVVVARPLGWAAMLKRAVPVYVAGFAGAYFLYIGYMGRSAFAPAPLEFFRAWALDLTFLVKPSEGQFWLWDRLGWSSVRSDATLFGDASVWLTTFGLPLLVSGIACFVAVRRHERRAWLLLAVAIVGLYFSLGPSLKVDAVKADGASGPFMQAQDGVMPTGSAIVSAHVPGFRAMRASYRWEALFLLGMWGLVALGAARARPRQERIWMGVYLLLILSSMPHLGDMWSDYRSYRRDLATIDRDVSVPLASHVHVGSKVFFMPFSNDVMANYLSPRLDVVSYNVGGDKQIEIARDAWPANLQSFAMNRFVIGDVPAIRSALLNHDADAVIIPYFDSLWAAHLWPCPAEARGYSARTLALFAANRSFLCPAQIRAAFKANVEALRQEPLLSVDDQLLFAIVRLKPMYAGEAGRRAAKAMQVSGVHYPLDIIHDGDTAAAVLGGGWHDREPANRWSDRRADITIPVPASCERGGCTAELRLLAFAATPKRPVSVSMTVADLSASKVPAVNETMTDDAVHQVMVPLPEGVNVLTLNLDVPAAASPATLGMSPDPRVLGISLLSIDIRQR